MAHDLLLVHAVSTLALAAILWMLQVTVVPRILHATAEEWPRHAATHRRTWRWCFWPLVVVEAVSGIGIALLRPAGIPTWLHGLNLTLIVISWCTTVVIRIRMGHGPVARYNPAGFLHYARLNWIRVGVWTGRSGIVIAMLRLAAGARSGGLP